MKKHERQNLKRRHGIDWRKYQNAIAFHGNECALCGALPAPRKRLVLDKYRQDGVPPLVCLGCLHTIATRVKNPVKFAKYLGLVDPLWEV